MRRNTKVRNSLAVAVVGVASFTLSLVWYSPWLFGSLWAGAGEQAIPGWKFAFAPLREIVSAAVVLFLIRRVRALDWKEAIALALVLWVGFYVVQLSGAVIWDNMPWKLGAVHAGDWLMKMLVMASALSAWQRREERVKRDERAGQYVEEQHAV